MTSMFKATKRRTPKIRTALAYGLIGAAGLSLAALAPAPTARAGTFTQVKAATLKHEGVRYWRKKANEAKLGSVGRKIKPGAGKNYFQLVQQAPANTFKVSVGGVVTIKSKTARKWSMTPAVSNGSVTARGKFGGHGKHAAKLTAYKMQIDLGNRPGNLRHEMNRHIKHLEALKEQGNSGRLISAVWILVDGEESQSQCYSGDLKVTYGGAVSVKVSGSGCSESTWTVAPGSIIAYEMVKVDKWDNKELTKRVECKSGYKLDVRKSPATPKDRCAKTTYETAGVQCKLAITDKSKNWYVQSKKGKDVCRSKKGKPNKAVKCSKSGYDYVKKDGRDSCRKPKETYKDPTCPRGYDYDKKSTSNGGKDQCHLRGVSSLKPDSMDGF